MYQTLIAHVIYIGIASCDSCQHQLTRHLSQTDSLKPVNGATVQISNLTWSTSLQDKELIINTQHLIHRAQFERDEMATDAAAPTKSFIIKHMNTSHADTLSLYLRAYCGVSAHFAHPAILQDISHSDLLITAKGTRYSVPINPPMTSFAEARARVVAMHKDSLQRLGLSDITIAEYRPPQGLQIVSLALVVATLVVFGRRSNFLPGSAFYETVGLDRHPVFTRFCYDVAPVVVGLLLGVHLVEATLLAIKRLRPHGVRVASGLWVAWIVSNFVEGFPVWRRFDEMVREERMKRERRSD